MSGTVEQEIKTNKSFDWMSDDLSGSADIHRLGILFRRDTLRLYRVEEITFEEKYPQEEALANVFASLTIPGINVIYLLVGDEMGIRIYFGVVEDRTEKLPQGLSIAGIGDDILVKSLRGNFRGSRVSPVKVQEFDDLIRRLFPKNIDKNSAERPQKKLPFYKTLRGVPGKNKDNEEKHFRGIDRLIDIMLGEEFAVLLLAKPIHGHSIAVSTIEESLDEIYHSLSWASRSQQQRSKSKAENIGTTLSQGTSSSKSETQNPSFSQSVTSNCSSTDSHSSDGGKTSNGGQYGWTQQENLTHAESVSFQIGTTEQLTSQSGRAITYGDSWGREDVRKRLQCWMKYLDDVVYPRLDSAKGRGMFVVSTLLSSFSLPVLVKLTNVMRAIYSGTEGNMVPFVEKDVTMGDAFFGALQAFHQPVWEKSLAQRAGVAEYAITHSKCPCKCEGGDSFYDGTWMSTVELSRLAGLPQKEVVGVKLRKEVEFGLNVDREGQGGAEEEKPEPIGVGNLVQGGEEKGNIRVFLDAIKFDRHIFVGGVTGSGKTTTCQQLLCDACREASGRHFLVIEPAKTEYRSLLRKAGAGSEDHISIKELLVFTLGNDIEGAPFFLNPLEFAEGESISARVDMLMASMTAAFNMEAAIPQILENAIYKAYEASGWDINTNTNRYYGKDAFADGVYSFPTLADVVRLAEEHVKSLGFDDRLRDEYLGSIRARMGGLLVGAKGRMLNCKRSINFEELLDHNVVLELEEIRNGQQKALVIGFVITNLMVAIKRKFNRTNQKIAHITLVEEAHRLLSRFEPGDDPNKRLAVETFSDMLAEVRKYGESMIIADQVPTKLTPDVLKNTNIKIIHRLFAQDDKEVVGATMSLNDDQKDFLSSLGTGHAIVFSGDWPKAVHVKVPKRIDTSRQRIVKDFELRSQALKFLAKSYRRGLFPGLEMLAKHPSVKLLDAYYVHVMHQSFDAVVAFMQNPSEKGSLKRASCLLKQTLSFLVKLGMKGNGLKILSCMIAACHLRNDACLRMREPDCKIVTWQDVVAGVERSLKIIQEEGVGVPGEMLRMLPDRALTVNSVGVNF